IGHEKGRNTETRLKHNFGMAHPEGYRKAARLMDLADKFKLPVLSFVDTAGAYPGKAGEERGQAEAIARSTERCLTLPTPMVSLIVGEGGSGGAIAIASANKVAMMEHAIYSVISPEGCASILYRDAARAKDAAEAMKITSNHLLRMHVVDEVVKEPVGGAHRDPQKAIKDAGRVIEKLLKPLTKMSAEELIRQRRERFYAIGRDGFS
ncbi:MAG: carboxyltransferase subunit alpha, partial [Pseudomonadota bacterium]